MSIGLVKIIMKARGDDVAGAVDDLTRIGGFPEEVAQRIATGELPMDEASRVARREAQTVPTDLYHGSTHDIKEFSGEGVDTNDWGRGTYLTDSTHDATRNYAGTHGPDFDAKVDMNERQEDYDWGLEHLGTPAQANDYSRAKAVARLKGENDGVIYPLRVKPEGLLDVTEEVKLPNYEELAIEDLGYAGKEIDSEMYDEVLERAWELEELSLTNQGPEYLNPNDSLFSVVNKYEGDVSAVPRYEEGDRWSHAKSALNDTFMTDEHGDYVGTGRAAQEVLSDTGARGIHDPSTPERFQTMESGEHTVIFPGNEDMIRSANAAFDPQYKGKNIMGEATVPLLGLLSTGTAGAGLLLKSLFAEAEEARR
jgi:hypothetical protein